MMKSRMCRFECTLHAGIAHTRQLQLFSGATRSGFGKRLFVNVSEKACYTKLNFKNTIQFDFFTIVGVK